MPRELTPTRNVVEILDPLAGEVLTLFCRTPERSERVAYRAEQLEREGDDILLKVFEVRVQYGARLLEGVHTGAFVIAGQPLSSEPGMPGYREDWRLILAAHAPELLEALAVRVFESARVVRLATEEPLLPRAGTAGQVVERVEGPFGSGSGAS